MSELRKDLSIEEIKSMGSASLSARDEFERDIVNSFRDFVLDTLPDALRPHTEIGYHEPRVFHTSSAVFKKMPDAVLDYPDCQRLMDVTIRLPLAYAINYGGGLFETDGPIEFKLNLEREWRFMVVTKKDFRRFKRISEALAYAIEVYAEEHPPKPVAPKPVAPSAPDPTEAAAEDKPTDLTMTLCEARRLLSYLAEDKPTDLTMTLSPFKQFEFAKEFGGGSLAFQDVADDQVDAIASAHESLRILRTKNAIENGKWRWRVHVAARWKKLGAWFASYLGEYWPQVLVLEVAAILVVSLGIGISGPAAALGMVGGFLSGLVVDFINDGRRGS